MPIGACSCIVIVPKFPMSLPAYWTFKYTWTLFTALAESWHTVFIAGDMNIQSIIDNRFLGSTLSAIGSTHIPHVIIEVTQIAEVLIYIIRVTKTYRAKTVILSTERYKFLYGILVARSTYQAITELLAKHLL